DGTESEIGAEIIIRASTEHPSRAGAAAAAVNAGVRDAQQTVHEEMQLVVTSGELRAKENVVFAGADASFALIVSSQIGLQPELVIKVAGKSGFPSAGVGESIAVEKRVADEYVTGRAFMAHVACTLGPTADREE